MIADHAGMEHKLCQGGWCKWNGIHNVGRDVDDGIESCEVMMGEEWAS